MKPQVIGIVIVIILGFLVFRTYSPDQISRKDTKISGLTAVSQQAEAKKDAAGKKAASLSQIEAGAGGKSLLVSGKTQSAWDSFVNKARQFFTGGTNFKTSSSTDVQSESPYNTTDSLSSTSPGTSETSASSSVIPNGTGSTGSGSGSESEMTGSGTVGAIASGSTSSSSSESSSAQSSGSSGNLLGMPSIAGKTDAELQAQGLYVMENGVLQYIYDRIHSRVIAYDKRASKQWWAPVNISNFSVRLEKLSRYLLRLYLAERNSTRAWTVDISMDETAAEVIYEIKAPSNMAMSGLVFPPVFEGSDTAEVIAPIAEGLKLPINFFHENFPGGLFYAGSRPMPFLGILENDVGFMQILETPNDCMWGATYVSRAKVVLFNQWQSEKGFFGYDRRIRFCFFDQGGYVAMAKRFREFAISKGWLVTLETKNNARNGNIDKLVGAVDVWYFSTGRLAFARELKNKGISKVLFSMYDRSSRATIEQINDLGFLTALYDNYRDTWPPEVPGAYSHEGWPNDLVLDRNGQPLPGWVATINGIQYTGGQVCSIPALARARQRVTADLAEIPFNARLLDTTTAVIWHQCYHPSHATTKTVDGSYRMRLLGFVSGDKKNVTGSEDGIADAVPVADYFEGMLSIHAGRLPNSGNNVFSVPYMTPTKEFMRYQVGVSYRIPLWELIFHDTVVTTWYWGDSTNRIPEVWWRRDLFNILYGNMPLWAIRDYAHWRQLERTFIASYRNVSPVFEKVGYKEMLTHAFLTEDHSVQETTFSGNISVVVNFGSADYPLAPSVTVRAHGFVVLENGTIWKSGVCDY